MAGLTGELEAARAAYARQDWPIAYETFAELRARGELGTDDLVALGDAAWWLGRIQVALQLSEDCFERYQGAGRSDLAATVALETAFNWFLRGQPEVGSGWLSRGRRLLATLPPGPGHAFVMSIEAGQLANAGDLDRAVEVAGRMRDLGQSLEDPGICASALALEGGLLIRRGELERGFALFDEAMLPVLAGRVRPELAGNLYCQLMSICHDLADVVRARHWTDVTQRWCETFASAVMFVGICRVHRTQLLRLQGDWDRAVREASAASVELAELNVEAVAEAHYEIGETHRLRGSVEPARAAYQQAERLGRVCQPGQALLLLAEGRLRDADAEIGRALAEETDPFRRARLLAAQVEISCARHDPTAAGTAAAALDEIAKRFPSPGFRVWAAQARGAALLACGSAASAAEPLRMALAGYRRMRAEHDVATVRVLLAEALDGSGDPVAAEAERVTAHEAFQRLGAKPRLTWMANRDRRPPGGLTAREVEILATVAAGRSNRQVAASYVISEKTVARHLANIYAKIGVSGRTEAAAWAHRHGLVGDQPIGSQPVGGQAVGGQAELHDRM